MSSNSTIRTFVLGSIAALVLSACGTPEAAAPGAMAAPEINVATVVHEKITEWDEFTAYDWQKIYDNMYKPAFVFDGRNILNSKELESIGFVYSRIGS